VTARRGADLAFSLFFFLLSRPRSSAGTDEPQTSASWLDERPAFFFFFLRFFFFFFWVEPGDSYAAVMALQGSPPFSCIGLWSVVAS